MFSGSSVGGGAPPPVRFARHARRIPLQATPVEVADNEVVGFLLVYLLLLITRAAAASLPVCSVVFVRLVSPLVPLPFTFDSFFEQPPLFFEPFSLRVKKINELLSRHG